MKIHLTLILINLIIFINVSNANNSDEVLGLPGLTKRPTFRQYSGYLNASEGHHLYYWLVESQSNPETDPLILWLNGGPGCSSLYGFWTENGPFRVINNGRKVVEDPNSWNTLANVLYIESPVGTGFSYSSIPLIFNSDDSTAEDNYLALLSFFRQFPQFANHSFYITGESYAGVYIPMLALKIFRETNDIKLKGVAIGNGAFDRQLLVVYRALWTLLPFYPLNQSQGSKPLRS